MDTIEVVAAVIKDGDRYLATQRGYGNFKGMWEFPGGKIETNEEKEDALIREIKEELNTDINVDKYLCTVEYDYPDFHLIMHAYICSLINNKIENVKRNEEELEHDSYKWLTAENISEVDWLPADIEIINQIKTQTR